MHMTDVMRGITYTKIKILSEFIIFTARNEQSQTINIIIWENRKTTHYSEF